ncbi:MAG: UDP-N-acetylmuramate--L-alanine ligase [Clostridia bacterium]|nr:UDP-N-acetylmuramate--L-alanine ligase [Clostridia bacterium]
MYTEPKKEVALLSIISHDFDQYKKFSHIHFVGIGGVSMSSLALILKHQGKCVTGSDSGNGPTILKLKEAGIPVYPEHTTENAVGCDLLVYTAAISDNNPELVYARENNIPMMERAVLLGYMMAEFKKSIAVSGTHGKTTVTSLLSSIFKAADADPTVMVGANLKAIGGNYCIGKSEYAIYEACEYVNSFHHFYPNCGIILNIDEDHLDFFKDLDAIQKSFARFTDNFDEDGFLVINGDDENCRCVRDYYKGTTLTFGIGANNDCYAENITINSGYASFDIHFKDVSARVDLKILGKHNILNALAAACAAFAYGLTAKDIKAGLEAFTGADRRFELKGTCNGAWVIDDYAHHPTEIRATLESAKQAAEGVVYVVFQPHTFTRTFYLMDEFAEALSIADRTILTDIYAAREINKVGVNILNLRDRIENARYISKFEDIAATLKQELKKGDIAILMGAGNVNQIAGLLTE